MTDGCNITLNISQMLHYSRPKLSKINNDTLSLLMKDFAFYMKDLYYGYIYDAMYSRRYNGDWEPVEDIEYVKYLGTQPTEIHILDLVYDAMKITWTKDSIIIGIDTEVQYPGSSRTLSQVVRSIDRGTSKFNSRPIMNQIINYLNANYLRFWDIYLLKKGAL